MIRFSVACLLFLGPTCACLAQNAGAVKNAARNEGIVRHAISVCFSDDANERARLAGLSTAYLQALSVASSIPIVELEAQARAGQDTAAAKPLTSQQCDKGRAKILKLIGDRARHVEL